jgi:hypothetical protein
LNAKELLLLAAVRWLKLVFIYEHEELPLRNQTQHAALLVTRDSVNSKINLYLQDRLYTDNDVEVARRFSMKILNGGLDHHEGLLRLDDSTLLIDLSVGAGYFWDMVSEITMNKPPLATLSIG